MNWMLLRIYVISVYQGVPMCHKLVRELGSKALLSVINMYNNTIVLIIFFFLNFIPIAHNKLQIINICKIGQRELVCFRCFSGVLGVSGKFFFSGNRQHN